MQGTQMEFFNQKEKEILKSMFGGEQKLKEEFPALYEDMVKAQKQNAKVKTIKKAASRQEPNFPGWEDYEKLKLFYQPNKKTLMVKGRIHKSGGPRYMMADLIIKNRQGKSWEFRYSVDQCSFLIMDEEIKMEKADLEGICAEVNYVLKVSETGRLMRVGRMREGTVRKVSEDIIGEGKIVHPVSRFGRPKIDIVYYRWDKGQSADYYYQEPDRVNNNFCVYLPIAVQFKLESNKAVAENPDVKGDVYIYSSRHSRVRFNNFGEIKLIPASQWDDASMNRRPGANKPFQYPSVNEKSSGGYVLIFPMHWKNAIEKDGVEGDDDFYLSLDIEFKCTDGKTYSFSMNSLLKPKKYEGGGSAEIPCLHILWGCLEKTAKLQTKDRGMIRICDVKIGDQIACLNGIYKRVTNIYKGNEEILKFIKAGGNTVKVTMDHPVMTKDGWKQARKITEADQICMEEGIYCKVDEVYDEPYYDQVYSLEIEDGEGFFANGFYVGDFGTQNRTAEPEPKLPQEILDELEKFKNLS